MLKEINLSCVIIKSHPLSNYLQEVIFWNPFFISPSKIRNPWLKVFTWHHKPSLKSGSQQVYQWNIITKSGSKSGHCMMNGSVWRRAFCRKSRPTWITKPRSGEAWTTLLTMLTKTPYQWSKFRRTWHSYLLWERRDAEEGLDLSTRRLPRKSLQPKKELYKNWRRRGMCKKWKQPLLQLFWNPQHQPHQVRKTVQKEDNPLGSHCSIESYADEQQSCYLCPQPLCHANGSNFSQMPFSTSGIRRSRSRYRSACKAEITASYKPEFLLVLHWDRKLMPYIMGKD